MKIASIHNKITGNIFPGGVFGENFEKYCADNPDEFRIVYEIGQEPEVPDTINYSVETLKTFSFPKLRDIYKVLAEGVDNPPAPTTSVDGIIKAIAKLQGE